MNKLTQFTALYKHYFVVICYTTPTNFKPLDSLSETFLGFYWFFCLFVYSLLLQSVVQSTILQLYPNCTKRFNHCCVRGEL